MLKLKIMDDAAELTGHHHGPVIDYTLCTTALLSTYLLHNTTDLTRHHLYNGSATTLPADHFQFHSTLRPHKTLTWTQAYLKVPPWGRSCTLHMRRSVKDTRSCCTALSTTHSDA